MSNAVRNAVTTRQETLTPTRPSPTQPSPARPLSSWSPSTTSSLSYARGSAAGVDTTTRNEMVTDLLADFYADVDIPCEGQGCLTDSHPADYIVDFLWPHGCRYRGPRCHVWWTADSPLQCCTCPSGVSWGATVEDVCRIVEVLR